GRNRLIEKIHSRTGIEETSYPHGAAMLISRENVKKVGLMSENYFLYYEELDWGTRVRNGGLKVGVCMSSKIVHKESATVGKISDCKLYFITRNRILYARKHFSKTRKAIFTLFFLLVSSPKNMFSLLLKRNFQGLRTYWEAIWWNLKHDTGSTRLGYKFDHLLKGS
ncbi:MAG: glycosyltransferase family 2 protein, partial [Ekhidna sp.]|nr:glycosyltransferase family 2 protein [Ekhidna sp.]